MVNPFLYLPTSEQLAGLPRLACLAFSARCARRLSELVLGDAFVDPKLSEAVQMSVAVAEAFGAGFFGARGCVGSLVRRLAAGVRECERQRNVAASIGVSASELSLRAVGVESSLNLGEAGHGLSLEALEHVAGVVALSVSATAALVATSDAACTRAAYATRRDFDVLEGAAELDGWSDNTPVAPTFFADLWTTGRPLSWPGAPVPGTGTKRFITRTSGAVGAA